MPKSAKSVPIPGWLKDTLKKVPPGQKTPDTLDFQIVSTALAGVELEFLKSRFKIPAADILESVIRVTCAIREQRVEGEVFTEYPELKALRVKRIRRKEPKPEALAVVTEGLPEIVEGDPDSFKDFLEAAKLRHAKSLVPATLQALEMNVRLLDQPAISKSLEMFYGVGKRGPGVAVQINQGGPQKEAETPHFFEQTILDAEVAEGSKGGETTVFDERLLGQQEEETEAT